MEGGFDNWEDLEVDRRCGEAGDEEREDLREESGGRGGGREFSFFGHVGSRGWAGNGSGMEKN